MTLASNYALRLPASLKREVEKLAKDDGTSLNQFIVMAVAEKLSAMRTAAFFAERSERADVDAALTLLRRDGGLEPQVGDRIQGKPKRRPRAE